MVDPTPDADLFEPVYSPHRVRFWLRHWDELETLADAPRTSAHLAEHLQREWFLLREDPKIDCLCAELHDADQRAVDPACAHAPAGGGSFKAGAHTASQIRADLELAANALPLVWRVTPIIFSLQGRLGQWEFRFAVSRGMAGQRPTPAMLSSLDASTTFYDAARRMARSLGWTPPIRGAGHLIASVDTRLRPAV